MNQKVRTVEGKPTIDAVVTSEVYKPKTRLGKKLWEIRKRIVASGTPLLGWEEIEKEVAERRDEAD